VLDSLQRRPPDEPPVGSSREAGARRDATVLAALARKETAGRSRIAPALLAIVGAGVLVVVVGTWWVAGNPYALIAGLRHSPSAGPARRDTGVGQNFRLRNASADSPEPSAQAVIPARDRARPAAAAQHRAAATPGPKFVAPPRIPPSDPKGRPNAPSSDLTPRSVRNASFSDLTPRAVQNAYASDLTPKPASDEFTLAVYYHTAGDFQNALIHYHAFLEK
jgi:hypothetical protein